MRASVDRARAGCTIPRVLPTLTRAWVRSPAARPAAQNLGWLVAEKMARLVFSVLIGFVVARYLGPAQFGALSYAMALVAIGVAVAECGVSGLVRREVASGAERAAAGLAAAWRLRLLAGAGCYAVLLCWAELGEPDRVERGLLLMLGLLLFQPALAVADLWLQARLKARLGTLAQILALGAGAALRLWLVAARAPLWGFALAAVAEAAVAAGLLTWFARRAGRPAGGRVSRAAVAQLWRESWPLLLSGLMVMIYIRIDVVMVRQLVGESAAGIYAAAVRISELGFFLPGAVASSLLPALLRARGESRESYHGALQRFMDACVALAYTITVPLVLLAPWIMRAAYGPAFAGGAAVLSVHGWTQVWVAIGVARGQYCINESLTRLHLAATAAGALLNIALNFVLIPRAGAVGAAWATLAAQMIAAWMSSYWFESTRECARLQTRALLLPLRWIRHALPSRPAA